MALRYYDVQTHVDEANTTIRQYRSLIRRSAEFAAGRLRDADTDPDTLRKLKRELRDFGMHTGQWKGEK